MHCYASPLEISGFATYVFDCLTMLYQLNKRNYPAFFVKKMSQWNRLIAGRLLTEHRQTEGNYKLIDSTLSKSKCALVLWHLCRYNHIKMSCIVLALLFPDQIYITRGLRSIKGTLEVTVGHWLSLNTTQLCVHCS